MYGKSLVSHTIIECAENMIWREICLRVRVWDGQALALDDNLANYWLNSMKARQRLGSRRFEGFKIQDYSYYHEFLRNES